MRGISSSAFVLCLLAIIAMGAASLYAWQILPTDKTLPMGWGEDGEPVRFAEPWLALSVLPALALLVSVIFALIPTIEPRQENLARSSFAFRVIWVAIIGTLMLMHFGYISAIVFEDFDFAVIRNAVIGTLFMVVGFVMPGVKSNFFVGVRTPWTLSSETVWRKTHRIAGPLVFLFGLALIIAAFGGARPLYFRILIIGAVVLAVVLVLLSLVLWLREKAEAGKT